MKKIIENLVAKLPEIYQPIYGHPTLSGLVSRSCHDRFEKIAQIYDALQDHLGRSPKVLDLGCAQGYFSLNLAARGGEVHGIDYLDKNIAVCNALAQTHPHFKVTFETNLVENIITRLKPCEYDLVLALSVFHHVVYEKGIDEVKGLLGQIVNQSGALVVELALREEPLYWAPSQPEDPKKLLENIAFVRKMACHETHLSPILRPMYFVSNRYWQMGHCAGHFDSYASDSHALAHGAHRESRRYFFSEDIIIKYYDFKHPLRVTINRHEFEQEVQFLKSPPPKFPAAKFIVADENNSEGWVVMERLPGRLLLDLLLEGSPIDHHSVLLAVLEQLVILEKVGLYHNDIRTWNVLVTENDAVYLFDYGSISSEKLDCCWPENLFLAFFIFVREITTGVVEEPNPLRTISISPFGLPQPYCTWAMSLWRHPLAEWSFQLMLEILLQMSNHFFDELQYQPVEAWMKATEEAIQAQIIHFKDCIRQIEENIQHVEIASRQAEQQAQKAVKLTRQVKDQNQQAEKQIRQAVKLAWQAKDQNQQEEEQARQAEKEARQAEEEARQAEKEARKATIKMQDLYNSRSWRITAPLRWIVFQAKLLKQHGFPARIKALAKKIVRPVVQYWPFSVASNFGLRRCSVIITKRLGIYTVLHRIYVHFFKQKKIKLICDKNVSQKLSHLTPNARHIYYQLKTAVAEYQKKVD
jgi:O-antigen chain-terminating methyltransferase